MMSASASAHCWRIKTCCIPLLILCLVTSPPTGSASLDIYVSNDFHPSSHNTSRRLAPLDKQPIEPNPMFISPSEGTDISSKPTKLVSCRSQTRCIAPSLQLQRKFNVYYCKRVSHGVRFYYLIREGLTLHPNVNLVETPEEADVIVYLPESANWAKSECKNPAYFSKMVVLDESDGSHILAKPNPKGGPWYILYFKRSFVNRQGGLFKGYMKYLHSKDDVFPMTYPLGESYVKPVFNRVADRDYEVVCTLRDDFNDAARKRVRRWVNDYAKLQGLSKYQGEQVNRASRTTVDQKYFGQMYRAKIVVTVNPAGWEGDFRFMEAVASGALVFVDYMYAPRPFPLLHEKHVIYYDNNNKTDLFRKLDYYRERMKTARMIAINGYLHAMKHHRTACLVDYVLRSVEIKLAQRMHESSNDTIHVPAYTNTGFDMHSVAIKFERAFKDSKKLNKNSPNKVLVQNEFEGGSG